MPDQRTKHYARRILEEAERVYNHDPIFHNRVDLAVDIMRATDAGIMSPLEVMLARTSAIISLYLEHIDRLAKEE